jgi:hypothetical protein
MDWNGISAQDWVAAGELEAAFPVTAGGPDAMRVARPSSERRPAQQTSAIAFKTRKANRGLPKHILNQRARRYNCA